MAIPGWLEYKLQPINLDHHQISIKNSVHGTNISPSNLRSFSTKTLLILVKYYVVQIVFVSVLDLSTEGIPANSLVKNPRTNKMVAIRIRQRDCHTNFSVELVCRKKNSGIIKASEISNTPQIRIIFSLQEILHFPCKNNLDFIRKFISKHSALQPTKQNTPTRPSPKSQ